MRHRGTVMTKTPGRLTISIQIEVTGLAELRLSRVYGCDMCVENENGHMVCGEEPDSLNCFKSRAFWAWLSAGLESWDTPALGGGSYPLLRRIVPLSN